MKRFSWLSSALMAALAVVNMGGGCCPEQPELAHDERVYRDQMAAEFDACLADDNACEALCHKVLIGAGLVDDVEYPPFMNRCTMEVLPGAEPSAHVSIRYYGGYECSAGRRPAGRASAAQRSAEPTAAWLCEVAHLEALSVTAFVELARDLSRHGAPARLVRAALSAAADEVAHAGVVAELAKRFGGHVTPPVVEAPAERALVEVAMTNAVEGCVRELLGALIAAHQGQHARDAEVRAAFTAIAADELRHAELAFEVDRWARSVLPAEQAALVEVARAEAGEALVSSEPQFAAPAMREALGLPDRDTARALAQVAASIPS